MLYIQVVFPFGFARLLWFALARFALCGSAGTRVCSQVRSVLLVFQFGFAWLVRLSLGSVARSV